MHETFIVTVMTEDGKCLIQGKITGGYLDLCSLLSQSSLALLSRPKAIQELKTLRGSIIFQSASAFSSPTPSSHAETS